VPSYQHQALDAETYAKIAADRIGSQVTHGFLARMFHELMSRDCEDGCATGQPQGVGSEAYLNGTSQGPTPEDARKDGQIRGRSKRFMEYPG
jgi:hypothetical protein